MKDKQIVDPFPFVESRDRHLFVTKGYGYAFPLHLHTHLELFLVHEGSILVSVADKERLLTKGSMAVVLSSQVHSYSQPSEDNHNTTAVIDLSFVGPYLDTVTQYHPVDPFIPPELVHENIPYALDQLNTEYWHTKRREVYTPLVQLALARVFDVICVKENSKACCRETTWLIAEYVSRHFREPLSLDTVAKNLSISKFQLSRQFSSLFGQSFSSYVNNIRLLHASCLLEETQLSITDISEEAGFGSLRTFFRVFQKEYGVSPLAFRSSRAAVPAAQEANQSATNESA